MVRKKVRTQFLHGFKNPKQTTKKQVNPKTNSILTFQNPNKQTKSNKQRIKQTNKHGKEKDKNSILTFPNKQTNKVRKKKNLTFEKKIW